MDWQPPVKMRQNEPTNPGENEYKLVNVPEFMIGGQYIGSTCWPGGTMENLEGQGEWAWTIDYEAPVKLYIWAWDPQAPGAGAGTNAQCFTANSHCTGEVLEDVDLAQDECIDRCKSTDACKCVTWGAKPNKKCRLETGTSLTTPSQYKGALMNDCAAAAPVTETTKMKAKAGKTGPTAWKNLNAGLDATVTNQGWIREQTPDFHRSDNPSFKMKVWSKIFFEGKSVVIDGLKGLLVGGVVSQDATGSPPVTLSQVVSASGGGVEWFEPRKISDFATISPKEAPHLLVNLPNYLNNGFLVSPHVKPEWPGQKEQGEWDWTIKYAPPVKLFVWVWAHLDASGLPQKPDYSAGAREKLLADGWTSEPADAFKRAESSAQDSQSNRLEIWSKVFTGGEETIISGLKGRMMAGIVSKPAGDGA